MKRYSYEDYLDAAAPQPPSEKQGQLFAKYSRHFNAGGKIVDLGCGRGQFLRFLARQGFAACGVDHNPAFVRGLQQEGLTVMQEDVLGFLERGRREGLRFDGLFASHLIEHLRPDQLESLVENASHILRPSGRLVLVYPNPESFKTQMLFFWIDPTHVRMYHYDYVMSVLRFFGFEIVYHNRKEKERPTLGLVHAFRKLVARALGLRDVLYHAEAPFDSVICAQLKGASA